MLKKIYRLSNPRLSNPKTISSSFFTLKTAKNNLKFNRFAFIVTKKMDKRATIRNLTRRKLRSSIEEIFDRIELGNDFVFYPKSKIIQTDREGVLREVKKVFSNQKLLIND